MTMGEFIYAVTAAEGIIIFVYVQWTMKIKWYPLQQWLH